MEFYIMYFFACFGIATFAVAVGWGIAHLVDKFILKGWRPRKHWKMDKKTYEWLGRWEA